MKVYLYVNCRNCGIAAVELNRGSLRELPDNHPGDKYLHECDANTVGYADIIKVSTVPPGRPESTGPVSAKAGRK